MEIKDLNNAIVELELDGYFSSSTQGAKAERSQF